mmetsp:Transcript_38260/g.80510  ORF Transcript_38260/g.80510 Transcript_38260/m.80510 type:complete len:424 (+) Transcript_38260:242-1513(+)
MAIPTRPHVTSKNLILRVFTGLGLIWMGAIWGQYSVVDRESEEHARASIESLQAEVTILKERLMEAQNLQQNIGIDMNRTSAMVQQIREEFCPDSEDVGGGAIGSDDGESCQKKLDACRAAQNAMYKNSAQMMDENANLKKELNMAKGGQHNWEVLEIPIMKSISRGFHPVYVYSKAIPEPAKESYSQVKQDVVVLALLKASNAKNATSSTHHSNNTRPFFVDLAANDATRLSNTYLLESKGWDGLCIEPNPQYWYRLASFRKCTIVAAFVGGTEDGVEVDVVLTHGKTGGIVGEGMDNRLDKPNIDGEIVDPNEMEKRNLVSLMTLFNETNVPRVIDYLSLDVEGAESLVMKDFPWTYYTIKIMTIERPKGDLKRLLRTRGFEEVSTISTWGETVWIHKESIQLSKEEIGSVIKSAGATNFG